VSRPAMVVTVGVADGVYDLAERLDRFRAENPRAVIGARGRTGSLPVSGKTRAVTAPALHELLGILERLAALEAARARLQAEYPGRRIWLSAGDRWYATRLGGGAHWHVLDDDEFAVRPMTLDADDEAGLRELLAAEPGG
jgi:hypothetical protein